MIQTLSSVPAAQPSDSSHRVILLHRTNHPHTAHIGQASHQFSIVSLNLVSSVRSNSEGHAEPLALSCSNSCDLETTIIWRVICQQLYRSEGYCFTYNLQLLRAIQSLTSCMCFEPTAGRSSSKRPSQSMTCQLSFTSTTLSTKR